MNTNTDYLDELEDDDRLDFHPDFVGFDCLDEIISWGVAKWECPFKPGCGATSAIQCPAMKQRAGVIPRAPKRPQ